MGVEDNMEPSSKQVTKRFLADRAMEFVRTQTPFGNEPRATRRLHAREIANRISKQAREEMKTNATL